MLMRKGTIKKGGGYITTLPQPYYPEKQISLKMLCMHHIIPKRYIHPSGSFYSRLFSPDRGPTTSRNTEIEWKIIKFLTVFRIPNSFKGAP
jgi:hypothetical protein